MFSKYFKNKNRRLSIPLIIYLLIGIIVAATSDGVVYVFSMLDIHLRIENWNGYLYEVANRNNTSIVLLIYLFLGIPYFVYKVVDNFVKNNSHIKTEYVYLAVFFVIFVAALFYCPSCFISESSSRWGQFVKFLLASGWMGIVVFYYFVFGLLVYGMAVLIFRLISSITS